MGEKTGNRYEAVEMIGKGGGSEVYKAFDSHLKRYVAIKKIHRDEAWAFGEAEILMKLRHPAIPVIYDVVKGENSCIIMEYMEGRSLLSFLEEGNAVAEEDAVKIGVMLGECLQYLHNLPEKIIYRDLKPANVLIDRRGAVKLIDFDSALKKERCDGSRTGAGTYGYSAPEQFMQGESVDERSDIYGLGTTLYHLLTGKDPSRPPYHFYKIREVNPLISEETENIVEKCMSEKKQERYGNMENVLRELRKVERGAGGRHFWGRKQKRAGRNKYMVEQKKNILLTGKQGGGLFALFLLMCLAVFGAGIWFREGQGQRLPDRIYAKDASGILPLVTYNGKREKIIIKNGTYYEADSDFHMAIPKECLKEDGVEVTVICKEMENGEERQRVVLLKRKKEK